MKASFGLYIWSILTATDDGQPGAAAGLASSSSELSSSELDSTTEEFTLERRMVFYPPLLAENF